MSRVSMLSKIHLLQEALRSVLGVFNCLRSQLKFIEDNGSIVNAASIAGIIGMKNNAAYSASKHALIGLTRSAAKEVGEKGTRVNAVAP
jgi:NAD(P)-dependent dehydrogenase (short-subunit alcohol dehydrogenase family)